MQEENRTSESSLPAVPTAHLVPSELPAVAASLVHEVKNPLAAIHLHLQLLEGYTHEIEDTEVREKIAGKVQFIKKEILGLNQSLHQFLRLLRPEQPPEGQPALPVDLNALVRDIAEFLEPQAAGQQVRVVFHPGEIAREGNFDPVFVKQVIVNLVLNAIQALSGMAPEEAPADRMITLTTGQIKNVNFVRVHDNGPGIPEAAQERIFEPFFSTKQEGSGLGLALVQKMIREMGGHVDLHSSPEDGTEFTVYLGRPRLIGGANDARA